MGSTAGVGGGGGGGGVAAWRGAGVKRRRFLGGMSADGSGSDGGGENGAAAAAVARWPGTQRRVGSIASRRAAPRGGGRVFVCFGGGVSERGVAVPSPGACLCADTCPCAFSFT